MNRFLWFLFLAYAAGVVCTGIWALSDFVFGDKDGVRFLKRILVSVAWPFVAMSQPGRDFLYKTGE